jgi:hypothetical protein
MLTISPIYSYLPLFSSLFPLPLPLSLQIEAGLLPIDEYEFKLGDCIESVVDLLHANARTKGIDLYAFVSTRCPATVMGDAARLRQVLMNLVSFFVNLSFYPFLIILYYFIIIVIVILYSFLMRHRSRTRSNLPRKAKC